MHSTLKTLSFLVLSTCLISACASLTQEQSATFKNATRPVFSLSATQDEMIVSVSPARQTLQIAGTTGIVLGAGISAIANAKYREDLETALSHFDAKAVFEKHIETRLHETIGPKLEQVAAVTTTAGYQNKRDAEAAYYQQLEKQGLSLLLDLKMTYGLFGYQGVLVAKIEGELIDLLQQDTLWRDTTIASSAPVLACDKLADPTKRLGPNFSALRLTTDEDAIAQWTEDGGKVLQERFESVAQEAVSALLTQLGLTNEAQGHFSLGKLAMNKKDFDQAHAHFTQALALEPDTPQFQNALAVNLAHQEKTNEAVQKALEIVEKHPEYGPAQLNLAWWYAVELDMPQKAQPHYTAALNLGMPALKKIEKHFASQNQN